MPASSISRATVVAAAMVAAACASAQAEFTFRPVALSGTRAPDLPAGQAFNSFKSPRIDDHGHVAFEATAGQGTSSLRGGWHETPENLKLSFVDRQPLPSLGQGYELAFPHGLPTVNGVNPAAFFGAARVPDQSYKYTVFGLCEGVLAPVAQEGQPIPGTGLIVGELNGSSLPVITPSGQSAFTARIGPTWKTGDHGLLTHRSGTLSYVAQAGAPAPGMDGWTFVAGTSEPVINHNGLVAFAKGVMQASSSATGIWVDNGTALRMVVNSHTPVPGQPNASFGTVGNPSINNAGQVAFTSYGTSRAIWLDNNGDLSMAARVGDRAPNTPDGVQFTDFLYPLVSGSGSVTFHGRLSGPGISSMNDWGIWSYSAGEARLLVREGQQAPGMPNGVLFGHGNGDWSVWGQMNALGQYAFSSNLIGPDMSSMGTSLWFADTQGVLRRVIGSGDTLTVASGDIRTIAGVSAWGFSGGQDGMPSFFNDRGELAFLAFFTDGSQGVFVTSAPEPAAAMLLAAGWIMLMRRQRRCND